MDTNAVSGFNAATFYKLASMFSSPFRDQAEKLLGLALADLRKEHNRFCDQFGEAGYAKARRDECAGLRYDLKRAFSRYAEGQLKPDELQDIIARVAERSAEIAQDAPEADDIPDTAPLPSQGFGTAGPAPSSSFAADFHIPIQPPQAPPSDPVSLPPDTSEPYARPLPVLSKFWRKILFWVLLCGLGYGLDEYNLSHPDAVWSRVVGALLIGYVLLWALRKLLPIFGIVGLLLKIALLVDCFFICYVIGFHETPWSLMHGGPFPDLARPVYPFVIACVLAAGIVILPEVSEWIRAKPSRLRYVLFIAAVLVIISVFVVRDRINSPAPKSNVDSSLQTTAKVDCNKMPCARKVSLRRLP